MRACAALLPTTSAMAKMTLLSRVSDGLPLAASMEDEKDHRELDTYKTQAKKIVKTLTVASPSRMTIESGGCFFQCVMPIAQLWAYFPSASDFRCCAASLVTSMSMAFATCASPRKRTRKSELRLACYRHSLFSSKTQSRAYFLMYQG